MRRLILSLVILTALAATPAAHAQALPDTVRNAGVTVAQWSAVQAEVRRAAAARGASERALAAVAARVSANLVQNGAIDFDALLASIDDRATQVAELQTQLAAMQAADDPAVAKLLADARAAIDAGDLTGGDALLAKAAESDLAGIAREEALTTARRTRAAATIGERGRLAFLGANFLGASALYAQAAETVPEGDAYARWKYITNQAGALYQRGDQFGELTALHEAVRLYRDVASPLSPRATLPSRWVHTQSNLAIVLGKLGERGDDQSLRDAVAVYRAVLQVVTRESTPENWARTQNNLGLVLRVLAERGDNESLSEAAIAYRSALTVLTRKYSPAEWAITQNNLGGVLLVLHDRGDQQAAQEAVRVFRAALEVYTRSSGPEIWAAVQNNLGLALLETGMGGDGQALTEAVAAFRAAMEVHTRANAPMKWAQDQSNLGLVLFELGERGDGRALQDAVASHRLALEVVTRINNPQSWADMQLNLSTALDALVRRGDRARLSEALSAARNALSGYLQVHDIHSAEEARRVIARLEAQ